MEMVRMTPNAAEAAALVQALMRALARGLRWVAGGAGAWLEGAGSALRHWAHACESEPPAIGERVPVRRTRGP